MSGPKTSKYTLTPEQRRILAEQREKERRRAIATESVKRNAKRLREIGGLFQREKQIASELFSRIGNDDGFTDLREELDSLIATMQPLLAKTNFDDVTSAEDTSEKMRTILSAAEKLVEKINVISVKNERKLNEILHSAIDKGFESSFADIAAEKTENPCSFIKEIGRKMEDICKNSSLPKPMVTEIEEAMHQLIQITDDNFARNFIAISVNPLLKRANQILNEYKLCHDEFERVYEEYIALCELYHYVAQEYLCSEDSIHKIKGEIIRIKQAAAMDDEQSYISECLDDVMADMGYTVIGRREVTKKSGKRFRNELFTYSEGTAVNVTYSSDGRIAMELGGLDSTDRVPTSVEADTLCSSMQDFCADFQEIEKRLLAKGIVVADRISMLPAEAVYAQIINTSDYCMNIETKSFSTRKQQRTSAKHKTMRKE